jgi:hypothetical protein
LGQTFHPVTNTLAPVTIFGGVFILAGLGWVCGAVYRSPYVSEATVVRPQPVPFSHKHHVAGLGIDCRFCHDSVDESAFAGIPSAKTCMTCHRQIWADAPILEPVRQSFREGTAIRWTRVHDLPDFAYFDHSIHVAKGVPCAACHGDVAAMPLMWRVETLFMEWCLDCHRHPERHLAPAVAARVHPRTDCSTCHR